ncbi:GDP-L-fucose synthase [Ponticaulis sp.]|jgi:GDP-L-fucose synthase|uniref:GDP-L-fucose synthase n=1 Tax=Ponticaulis sp. TaxID=2020902 RepID=UPI000C4F0DF8|nr:GDP-L-fucose synthase [Ponticaulis sp.]MAF58738.1 GDP-fucose synthetase [Ponticaulis sp.]MBN05504.1 GDP-fucose synthetase [Ponticaulis sp.]
MSFDLKGKKIFVSGHRGMVGSATVRRLEQEEGVEILTASRADMDLTRQDEVEKWMAANKPDVVFVTAAKVGGILANDTYPAQFIYENLMIEANLIHSAYKNDVEKLVYLGSSCIYPKMAPQPIPEDALLTGPLEPTNEWYAIAKIAGIKLCQAYRKEYGCDYISGMPTNLFGPNDNFDLKNSHVLPAIIRKVYDAKQSGQKSIEIWGTGSAKREFLHVDDCADAMIFLLKNFSGPDHINIGSGEDLSILELTKLIMDVVGYDGEIVHDLSKPDGTPRKLMQVDRLKGLGWEPKYSLRAGVENAYQWFLDNRESIRGL